MEGLCYGVVCDATRENDPAAAPCGLYYPVTRSSGSAATNPSAFPPRTESPAQSERMARADRALSRRPDDPDSIVEAAMAREEVWRYAEAIELYTRGISAAPGDYRMVLGRAHRLIRFRRFEQAARDLDRAFELDPYGFNTGYLRALTRYLRGDFEGACQEYARCMELAEDPSALELAATGRVPGDPRHCMLIAEDEPTRIAITSWRYRALRRAGRHDAATALVESIVEGIQLEKPPPSRFEGTIIRPDSNEPYYQTLLFFRGLRSESDVLEQKRGDEHFTTVGYGVAVWHFVEGHRDRAVHLLRTILAEPHWARLGHVAADADLARLSS